MMRRSTTGKDRTGRNALLLLTVASALLLALLCTAVESAPLSKSHLRTLRLCSRSLSDALYIVCRERGYNEPFSYSGEDEPRVDNGQGLVEECCYHSCSYEQLEQYCKPIPEEKRGDSRDVMEEPYRIVNLPYSSSATRDLSEESSEMDYAGGAIKRKVVGMNRARHRGKSRGRNECKGKADARKRHRGRHCRCRRRRLECRRAGKVLRGDVKSLDKFATSSPADTSLPAVS